MARLLFFGKLADIAGGRERDWPLGADVATVRDLIAAISAEDAALGDAISHGSVRCIVNETMAPLDDAVADEDEIAFIPPVSGG